MLDVLRKSLFVYGEAAVHKLGMEVFIQTDGVLVVSFTAFHQGYGRVCFLFYLFIFLFINNIFLI
jgi:hypothetical protein